MEDEWFPGFARLHNDASQIVPPTLVWSRTKDSVIHENSGGSAPSVLASQFREFERPPGDEDVAASTMMSSFVSGLYPYIMQAFCKRDLPKIVEKSRMQVVERLTAMGVHYPLALLGIGPEDLANFEVVKFDLGTALPEVVPLRVEDARLGRGSSTGFVMEFAVKLDTPARIHIRTGVGEMCISRVGLVGEVTAMCLPVVAAPPFVSAVQVYFANLPEITWQVGSTTGAFNVALPVLSGVMRKLADQVVSDMAVLPSRQYIHLGAPADIERVTNYHVVAHPEPIGALRVRVIQARDLAAADEPDLAAVVRGKISGEPAEGSSDPYCVLRLGAQTFQTKVLYKTLNPTWTEDNEVLFPVYKLSQCLMVTVWDKDFASSDNLGSVVPNSALCLEHLGGGEELGRAWGPRQMWLKLSQVDLNKDSQILLEMEYCPLVCGVPPQPSQLILRNSHTRAHAVLCCDLHGITLLPVELRDQGIRLRITMSDAGFPATRISKRAKASDPRVSDRSLAAVEELPEHTRTLIGRLYLERETSCDELSRLLNISADTIYLFLRTHFHMWAHFDQSMQFFLTEPEHAMLNVEVIKGLTTEVLATGDPVHLGHVLECEGLCQSFSTPLHFSDSNTQGGLRLTCKLHYFSRSLESCGSQELLLIDPDVSIVADTKTKTGKSPMYRHGEIVRSVTSAPRSLTTRLKHALRACCSAIMTKE
mmetsp:Transcript_75635/g.202189  ORF Transcript_75635/g.202189 Transcript_75635/m.202189 type:complete len:705 (+) Transcript_75635:22-2136(+)